MIKTVAAFVAGAVAGILLMSHAFNPMQMIEDTYQLARLSFAYGCIVEQGSDCVDQAAAFEVVLRQVGYKQAVEEAKKDSP